MATRKRKTWTPSKKAQRAGVNTETSIVRTTVVKIDLDAGKDHDLAVGDRVRIGGSGLYAGEVVTVERLTGSVIPAAIVRTASGRTRQVRAIDLTRVTGED